MNEPPFCGAKMGVLKPNTSYGNFSIGGFFMASKGPIFNKFNDEFKKTSYNKLNIKC